jgi:acetylornithine/succinyldiaminopimelate/putrescine aminotransferase
VRLLPPLIIDEAGVADGIAMIERACQKLSHAVKPVSPAAV